MVGNSWDTSSVDVAAAGVGWFAIGIKGEAIVGLWTYVGIEVIQRNALLPHRASHFEVSGFNVCKIVAEAARMSNKIQSQNRADKPAFSKSVGSPL